MGKNQLFGPLNWSAGGVSGRRGVRLFWEARSWGASFRREARRKTPRSARLCPSLVVRHQSGTVRFKAWFPESVVKMFSVFPSSLISSGETVLFGHCCRQNSWVLVRFLFSVWLFWSSRDGKIRRKCSSLRSSAPKPVTSHVPNYGGTGDEFWKEFSNKINLIPNRFDGTINERNQIKKLVTVLISNWYECFVIVCN